MSIIEDLLLQRQGVPSQTQSLLERMLMAQPDMANMLGDPSLQPEPPAMLPRPPSIRGDIGDAVYDASSRAGLGASAQRYRQGAETASDWVPGIGDAVGAQEAGDAYNAGNYGRAAFETGATFLGAVPIVGPAAKGLVKAGKVVAKKLPKQIEQVEYVAKPLTRKAGKQIVGAPAGVTTRRQEKALIEAYLKKAEAGVLGKRWYDEAGASNLYHTGGNVRQAQRFSMGQAVTSQTTGVDANLGHAITGHNQRMAGVPVRTGRFPVVASPKIERIYDANDQAGMLDAMGPAAEKIGPFGANIGRGGGFNELPLDRAVHDIWDGRNWGYKNADGSLFDGSFSSSNHRWMDKQFAEAVALANKRNLGGHSDWNNRSLQAATWVSGKAAEEGKPIEEMAKSFPDFFGNRYGQVSYESLPGSNTTHLPLLADADISKRNDHMDAVFNIMNNDRGQDKISLAHGALTGESFRGQGLYEGDINPGAQALIASGRASGGESVDQGSKAIFDSIAAQQGAALGQKEAAWHVPGPMGAKSANYHGANIGDTGVLDFKTDGRVGDNMFNTVAEMAGAKVKDAPIAVVPTPTGFRLLDFTGDGKSFWTLGQKIGAELGLDAPARRRMIGSNLLSNDWQKNPLAQEYMKYVDRPEFRIAFDSAMPEIAGELYKLDKPLAKQFGAGAGEIQKLRKIIANEGYDGLMRAIKGSAASIGAVGMMLEVMSSNDAQAAPSGEPLQVHVPMPSGGGL